MDKRRLRQVRSLMREVIEMEERQMRLACFDLTAPDADEELKRRLRDEIGAVEGFIRQIEDSMTRRAFRLRYLDGLSWEQIARRMGYANDSGARMLCRRYLEKNGS